MQPLVSPLSSTLGTAPPPTALPRAPIGPAEPAFRLPDAFLALQAWLFECEPPESEPASLVRRKIGGVLGLDLAASLFATPLRLAPETTPCPFEVVPFGTLRDGARLGWAVLAPELPAQRDYPCVSVPPFHGGVAGWFADDSRGALEALLVKEAREAARWSHEPVSPLSDPRWAELCRGVGLSPNLDAPPRSHPLRVRVPEGYRYEPAADGVGVLAPRWAFASDVPRLDHRSAHATLDLTIRAYLGAGFPGTALSICKAAMAGAELDPTFVEAMRGSYIALGRPLHALRADAWLRENSLQLSAFSFGPSDFMAQLPPAAEPSDPGLCGFDRRTTRGPRTPQHA